MSTERRSERQGAKIAKFRNAKKIKSFKKNEHLVILTTYFFPLASLPWRFWRLGVHFRIAPMQQMNPVLAYIALGSNLGRREQNIAAAIAKLRQTRELEVVRTSSLLENPAVGGPEDSPAFLNAVTEVRTTLSAPALLHRLLEIEQDLGRNRREKWEPRVIDLDLLLYGDHILSSQELIVPHPLMHERRFVLQPLAELVPDLVHPTLQMSVAGLLQNLTRR